MSGSSLDPATNRHANFEHFWLPGSSQLHTVNTPSAVVIKKMIILTTTFRHHHYFDRMCLSYETVLFFCSSRWWQKLFQRKGDWNAIAGYWCCHRSKGCGSSFFFSHFSSSHRQLGKYTEDQCLHDRRPSELRVKTWGVTMAASGVPLFIYLIKTTLPGYLKRILYFASRQLPR